MDKDPNKIELHIGPGGMNLGAGGPWGIAAFALVVVVAAAGRGLGWW